MMGLGLRVLAAGGGARSDRRAGRGEPVEVFTPNDGPSAAE